MSEEPPKVAAYFTDAKIISILLAVVGFLLTSATAVIFTQEMATQTALNAHIVDAANKASLYVRKDDLGEINARLQRIEDKLDQKADKASR